MTMTGHNIICFAKDFAEDPTSNHHVMTELAKHNRVLWVNSLSTRTPSLGSGRDLKKIVKKVVEFARGPQEAGPGLWVYTPLVLPLPHSRLAQSINKRLLAATIWGVRRRLGMDSFQLWTFLPNVGDYLDVLGQSLVVYYCTDEWSMFSYIDDRMAQLEEQLCERADVIFGVNQALVDSKRRFNDNTYLATHGVDQTLFARALDPGLEEPADIAHIPHPRIGFYGTLQDWVDQDLLIYLAKRNPDYHLVLIGGEMVDFSRLRKLPNVHLLGRRPHAQLPAYCKAFDVGLIPYLIDERMRFVNPIKLREYLSAGLPVVSTKVPEVERYGDICAVADSPEAFEAAVKAALVEPPARAQERSERMLDETWEHKVDLVRERISTIMEGK